MKKLIVLYMLLCFVLLFSLNDMIEKKVSKYYDYSKITDSLLFKHKLTDLNENEIDFLDRIYNIEEPILLCIATPYSCSSCNASFYPMLNEFTKLDSSRTCFIIENHYLRDTMKRYNEIIQYIEPCTRILFDKEGRNAGLLKFDDTGNNFWFVIVKKGRIQHVIGFADYQNECKPVRYYMEELSKYWEIENKKVSR